VLQKPSADERAAIDAAIAKALEVLPLCLSGDMQTAMHKLHTEEEAKKVAEKKAEPPPSAPAPTAKQPEKKEAEKPAERPGLLKSLFGKK
jgi:hypothetical protein